MADIALFHSALGVRPGVLDAADRLRAEAHEGVVVDHYDHRVFDDYDKASEFIESTKRRARRHRWLSSPTRGGSQN